MYIIGPDLYAQKNLFFKFLDRYNFFFPFIGFSVLAINYPLKMPVMHAQWLDEFSVLPVIHSSWLDGFPFFRKISHLH